MMFTHGVLNNKHNGLDKIKKVSTIFNEIPLIVSHLALIE
jgi:hypothetical protein